jgi:hypothetical protein
MDADLFPVRHTELHSRQEILAAMRELLRKAIATLQGRDMPVVTLILVFTHILA